MWSKLNDDNLHVVTLTHENDSNKKRAREYWEVSTKMRERKKKEIVIFSVRKTAAVAERRNKSFEFLVRNILVSCPYEPNARFRYIHIEKKYMQSAFCTNIIKRVTTEYFSPQKKKKGKKIRLKPTRCLTPINFFLLRFTVK